jgi:hypothetical protein
VLVTRRQLWAEEEFEHYYRRDLLRQEKQKELHSIRVAVSGATGPENMQEWQKLICLFHKVHHLRFEPIVRHLG